MTLIEGVRAFLLEQAAIEAIVSARVYPLRLPQKVDLSGSNGAIVLMLVSEVRPHHLRGTDNIARARLQIDSWARQRDQAVALGILCRERLDGYQGIWLGTGSPQPSIDVRAFLHESEQELFEEDILGGLCRHSADYFVSYSRSEDAILI